MRARRVYYRAFWGATKRADLLASLNDEGAAFDEAYEMLTPAPENRFSLRRGVTGSDYATWPTMNDLSRAPDWSGLLEKRKGALIAIDRATLEARIQRYADPAIPFAALRSPDDGPVEDAASFDARKARAGLIAAGGIAAGTFRRIMLLPFDVRWCFHTNVQPIWNRSRPDVAAEQAHGTRFLLARGGFRRDVFGFPVLATRALPGDYALDPNVHPFPMLLHRTDGGLLSAVPSVAEPNLSPLATAYLAALALPATPETSTQLWHHALATTYAPAYLAANAAGLRQGWPRIPLPTSAEAFHASAALGAQLAALLDPDTPVPGVTLAPIRPELAPIAVPTTRPGMARDWHLTAGWGSRSDRGITMPGRGSTAARPYAPAEAATAAHAPLLGAETLDLAMNPASYWSGVPCAVWETHMGGYQVLKKWLSYRDASILARPLTADEVAHLQATARRLAAILLLGPALNAAHAACATTTWAPEPPPAT